VTNLSCRAAYSKLVSLALTVDTSWTACDVMAQCTTSRWWMYWTASVNWQKIRHTSASVNRSFCHRQTELSVTHCTQSLWH